MTKDIKPEECFFRQISTGVVVSLKKEKDDFWDNLEKKPSMLKEKNENEKKDKDPGSSLMDMMKDMYNNVKLI